MLGITLQETRVYREIKEEGQVAEARSLIQRQLTRRVGELPEADRALIESLPLVPLEAFGEALLDFETLADQPPSPPQNRISAPPCLFRAPTTKKSL